MHAGATQFVESETQDRRALLGRFLSAYWLRPENAMWMTLRSEALSRCPLARPSVDLGCGDGVFTFLHCGGRFDPAFDVFASVGRLDEVAGAHADMFDHVTAGYAPPIIAPPAERVDCGADLKASMIEKARRLALYERLVLHDNNNPLPFDNESFETVYCNTAYWVSNIGGFLSELRRVVRRGGRIVLQVKIDAMRDYTLRRHAAALGDRFLDIIGRGRMETWPTLASRAEWERRFAAAGLIVLEETPFATSTHAHVWDIGLRPVAPMLIKMAAALTPATRAEIKGEWVALLTDLLEPLCDPGIDLMGGWSEPAEVQYVLA